MHGTLGKLFGATTMPRNHKMKASNKFRSIQIFFWALIPALAFSSDAALPAVAEAPDPRIVFAQHDPQGRLPNTSIQKLGVIRVRTTTYSIYYLDFSNPVSLHGLQHIAIIKNGTQFAGAYVCPLGQDDDEGKLIVGKDRLTVTISEMKFVIRFDQNGPTRNKYFCGEGSGWRNNI